MASRKPTVAGQFYPASAQQCREEIRQCLEDRPVHESFASPLAAGIVPHAGWIFSGDLAGMTFAAIQKANGAVDSFILLGAVHRWFGHSSAVYPSGSWQSPLGEIAIDEDLAGRIVKLTGAEPNPEAHRGEHSIEVQVPFVQYLFPQAKIVPILVPLDVDVAAFGERLARVVGDCADRRIACVASTDLTHYGPRYGFSPEGIGAEALFWAKNVNDREFIDLAIAMDAPALVQKAIDHTSACGPAAAGVAVAAAKALGKTQGILLAHTTSSEVMQRKFRQSSQESVGYAAMVF
jgi:MEMO1 family protein